MSRFLLSGMSSRHCNPAASARDVSFAFLLAEALRKSGHEVEHRNPGINEDLSGFDRVIVGVAPLHALGSNRVYGALSAILRTWDTGQLALMLDDPETGKIFTGIRTVSENPHRLTKPFFSYKLEYTQAVQSPWREWLEEGVKLLRHAQWPPVIVPQNYWAGTPKLVGNEGQVKDIVGVDPTAALGLTPVIPHSNPRDDVWVTEVFGKSLWLDEIKPFIRTPIEYHGLNGTPRFQKDEQRFARFSTARGVIVPPVCDGAWWQSRYAMASASEALVLTDWKTVRPLGAEWTLTPEKADSLNEAAARNVAIRQCEALFAGAPSRASIARTLEEI